MPTPKPLSALRRAQDKDTLRPFRILDPHKNHAVIMGRWYRWPENAHDAAVVICRRDTKVGRTVEVVNVRLGKLISTYSKRVDGIRIKNEEQLKEEAKRAGDRS